MDFSGPFEMSRQGNIYMVLFVDRATRFSGNFCKEQERGDSSGSYEEVH